MRESKTSLNKIRVILIYNPIICFSIRTQFYVQSKALSANDYNVNYEVLDLFNIYEKTKLHHLDSRV